MTADRTYVHLGPLKTGTTFIQNVLWKNEQLLAERGICLPRRNAAQHVRSVLSVMGKVVNADDARDLSGAWPAMAKAIRDWDGPTAVISQEFLCEARLDAIERLVHDLAPAEVHVIYTARDYTLLVPAMWQTHLRNKFAPPWPEYIESLRDPDGSDDPWGERFWHQQDPAGVLGRWGAHVRPERIHVVTVPPSGADPSLLWNRFAGVLGIGDPDAFDLDLDRANTSLGVVESEALRRVNLMVAGRIPGLAYQDLVKTMVAREILEREPNAGRLVLPAGEHDWVAARATSAVDYFSTGGFDVVGDLADLVPAPPDPDAVAPDVVDEHRVAALVQQMLGQVLVEMSRRQENKAYEGSRMHVEPQPAPSRWGLKGDPPRPGKGNPGEQPSPARRVAAKLRRRIRP